mgnify:FL=1
MSKASAGRVANARVRQAAAAIRERQLARLRSARESVRAVIDVDSIMAILERGATPQQLEDAASILATPPNARQRRLF